MTSVTIWGVAAIEREPAAYYTRSGALAEAEAFDQLAEELPDTGINITVGHGGETLGQLVYGEIDQAGKIFLVGVIEDPAILNIEAPIFYSPELFTVGRGMTRSRAIADLAGLTGLALTTDPAGLGLTPLSLREGDLRDTADRQLWPLSWRTADPLLSRALDAIGDDLHHRARHLHRHAKPALGYDGPPIRRPGGRASASGWWHSATPGRILSIS